MNKNFNLDTNYIILITSKYYQITLSTPDTKKKKKNTSKLLLNPFKSRARLMKLKFANKNKQDEVVSFLFFFFFLLKYLVKIVYSFTRNASRKMRISLCNANWRGILLF